MHAGPLSEVGELRDPTEDTHSIYGDSDLMSSDGRDQVHSHTTLTATYTQSNICFLVHKAKSPPHGGGLSVNMLQALPDQSIGGGGVKVKGRLPLVSLGSAMHHCRTMTWMMTVGLRQILGKRALLQTPMQRSTNLRRQLAHQVVHEQSLIRPPVS